MKNVELAATVAAVLLLSGCADAISDEQVKVMTKHCESQGMTVVVINAGYSQIHCTKK